VKRIGPELKMPKLKGGEMKVPPVLSDLYFDLRERRLLPLIALIIVAIVATPILLGGGSDEPEPVSPPAIGGSAPAAQSLTVVKAEPGLRNYKKRLGHRSATNPFKQRFTGPRLNGAQLNEPTATQTPSTTSTSSTEGSASSEQTSTSPPSSEPSSPSPGGSSPGSRGGGGKSGGNEAIPHGLTLFTFALDVEITKIEPQPDGSVVKSDPTLHREILAPAPLPGEQAPVVTYLGMGAETEQPMFLVSPEVTALYGKNKCVTGKLICQLVTLEEGSPETFEYGPNHVRYKFNVVGIEPVVNGHS
jgi:hypothetical protein